MDIWKDGIFVSSDSGMPWTEFENDRYWGIRHNFTENGEPMERGITLDGMTGEVLEDKTGPLYMHQYN